MVDVPDVPAIAAVVAFRGLQQCLRARKPVSPIHRCSARRAHVGRACWAPPVCTGTRTSNLYTPPPSPPRTYPRLSSSQANRGLGLVSRGRNAGVRCSVSQALPPPRPPSPPAHPPPAPVPKDANAPLPDPGNIWLSSCEPFPRWRRCCDSACRGPPICIHSACKLRTVTRGRSPRRRHDVR